MWHMCWKCDIMLCVRICAGNIVSLHGNTEDIIRLRVDLCNKRKYTASDASVPSSTGGSNLIQYQACTNTTKMLKISTGSSIATRIFCPRVCPEPPNSLFNFLTCFFDFGRLPVTTGGRPMYSTNFLNASCTTIWHNPPLSHCLWFDLFFLKALDPHTQSPLMVPLPVQEGAVAFHPSTGSSTSSSLSNSVSAIFSSEANWLHRASLITWSLLT